MPRLQRALARITSKGSWLVFGSLWTIANVVVPLHFWLLKWNTLKDKGDLPFNIGTDPSTLTSKVLFKCFCVTLKVSCLLSYAMVALTMCRWTWTQVSYLPKVRAFFPIEQFETLHKFSGVLGWFELLTVFVVYMINWGYLCHYYRNGNEDWNFCKDFYSEVMLTGYLLVLFHTIIVLLSIRAVRRKRYEFFYWFHHLFIAIFALSIVHPMDWRQRRGAKQRMQTWPVMIGPVGLYAFDRFMQYLTHRYTTAGRITLLKEPKTIFIKLHAPSGYLRQKPGMICWLNVRVVSWLNWHPFSIAHTDAAGSVYLIIHVLPKGWTSKLWDMLVMATPFVPFGGEAVKVEPGAPVSEQARRAITLKFQAQDRILDNAQPLSIIEDPVHGAAPSSESRSLIPVDEDWMLDSQSPRMSEFSNDAVAEKEEYGVQTSNPPLETKAQQASFIQSSVSGGVYEDGSFAESTQSEAMSSDLTLESRENSPPRPTVKFQTSIDQVPPRRASVSGEEERLVPARMADIIGQKNFGADDISRGLSAIRELWSKAKQMEGKPKENLKWLIETKSEIALSATDSEVWYRSLDMVPKLAKWSGAFGLSGPFCAGMPEAANFNHTIMIGGGSGIVPCLSHVKEFINSRLALVRKTQRRKDSKQYNAMRSSKLRLASFRSPTSKAPKNTEALSLRLHKMVVGSPIWAFGCYLYILLDFITGFGTGCLGWNESFQRHTLGSWAWPFFLVLHFICMVLFTVHKCLVILSQKNKKIDGWLWLDGVLIVLSLVILIVNLVTEIELPDGSVLAGWSLSGGIMELVAWGYYCNITKQGGYFCAFKQIDGQPIAQFVFYGLFAVSLFRWLRVWSQTPRLLSGSNTTNWGGKLTDWEKEVGADQQLQSMDVVWIMRSPNWLQTLERDIEDLMLNAHEITGGRTKFSLRIYITDPAFTSRDLVESFGDSVLRDKIIIGRPDFLKVLRELCSSYKAGILQGEKTGVFVSGPGPMQSAARSAYERFAVELSNETKTEIQLSWHQEKFV